MAKKAPGPTSSLETIIMDGRKVSFRYKDINRHFICTLCNGYFRDAQTIKECLHTFCNGCIRSYFWRNRDAHKCPTCSVHLGVKPWTQLISDPSIQGLISKIFPDPTQQEKKEELKFYKHLSIKRKEIIREAKAHAGVPIKRARAVRRLQFEVHPQRSPKLPLFFQLDRLKVPHMNTDATFKILYLKKFVAKLLQLPNFNQIQILCEGLPVGAEYSLDFIVRTRWKDRSKKLILEYRRQP
uniref:Uncharacterized protein AlNc14C463G11789 n=1 Tax=Albugo laibachii Nc14 TaxID=890382 RepID=F0X051_9STRA|nr:conserved hypothetical protein [Albugo laibachii Nc14]|eukprot:CCA27133.1 conserved hypothetical protein [Albugo laibachii Nc14]